MAKLLDLVDKLIGNVLMGNVYTDIDTYKAITHQTPVDAYSHIPNTDPRNLNVNQGTPHPHVGSNIIPQPPTHQMHGPPPISRQEIYEKSDSLSAKDSAPQDISAQSKNIASDASFSKGMAFDDAKRNDIYDLKNNPLASNIGGSQRSRDTLGQDLMSKGMPPSPRLDFAGDKAPRGLRTPGLIENNIYDDDSHTPFSGKFAQFSQSPVPSQLGVFDITATGHWLRNIVKEMGIPVPLGVPDESKTVEDFSKNIAKGTYFLASQFLLASLNPMDPEVGGPLNAVWNPLSLGAAIPLLGGLPQTAITLGAADGVGYKERTQTLANNGVDRLLLMRAGGYTELNPIHRASKLRTPIGPQGYVGDIAASDGTSRNLEDEEINISKYTTIQAQVDGGVDSILARKAGLHTNIYNAELPYGKSPVLPLDQLETKDNFNLDRRFEVEKLTQLFIPKSFPGAGGNNNIISTFIAQSPDKQNRGFTTNTKIDGVNADFPGEDDESLNAKLIEEGDIYLPFMFQDLRMKGPGKFLYFRAFLQTGISETFTVDWQTERFYGRVDQVPIYQGTIRNVNLTFDVVAWKPADLIVIWKKLYKLQSMVYPTYTTESFLKAGPIIRMRVGDLIAGSKNRGLPGYINSMDWSYDDGIWNIKADLKVPRKISVSIGFTALHNGNPGIYPISQNKTHANKDETETSTVGYFFGAGQNKPSKDGATTGIEVSRAEIRKIFAEVGKVKK